MSFLRIYYYVGTHYAVPISMIFQKKTLRVYDVGYMPRTLLLVICGNVVSSRTGKYNNN